MSQMTKLLMGVLTLVIVVMAALWVFRLVKKEIPTA